MRSSPWRAATLADLGRVDRILVQRISRRSLSARAAAARGLVADRVRSGEPSEGLRGGARISGVAPRQRIGLADAVADLR